MVFVLQGAAYHQILQVPLSTKVPLTTKSTTLCLALSGERSLRMRHRLTQKAYPSLIFEPELAPVVEGLWCSEMFVNHPMAS